MSTTRRMLRRRVQVRHVDGRLRRRAGGAMPATWRRGSWRVEMRHVDSRRRRVARRPRSGRSPLPRSLRGLRALHYRRVCALRRRRARGPNSRRRWVRALRGRLPSQTRAPRRLAGRRQRRTVQVRRVDGLRGGVDGARALRGRLSPNARMRASWRLLTGRRRRSVQVRRVDDRWVCRAGRANCRRWARALRSSLYALARIRAPRRLTGSRRTRLWSSLNGGAGRLTALRLRLTPSTRRSRLLRAHWPGGLAGVADRARASRLHSRSYGDCLSPRPGNGCLPGGRPYGCRLPPRPDSHCLLSRPSRRRAARTRPLARRLLPDESRSANVHLLRREAVDEFAHLLEYAPLSPATPAARHLVRRFPERHQRRAVGPLGRLHGRVSVFASG